MKVWEQTGDYWTIDYSTWWWLYQNCNTDITYIPSITFDGDNISPLSFSYPTRIIAWSQPVLPITNWWSIPHIKTQFVWFSKLDWGVWWDQGDESNTSNRYKSTRWFYNAFEVTANNWWYAWYEYAKLGNYLLFRIPDGYELYDYALGSQWITKWFWWTAFNPNRSYVYKWKSYQWYARWPRYLGNGTYWLVSSLRAWAIDPSQFPYYHDITPWAGNLADHAWYPAEFSFTWSVPHFGLNSLWNGSQRENVWVYFSSDTSNNIIWAPISFDRSLFTVTWALPSTAWAWWTNVPTSSAKRALVYIRCLDSNRWDALASSHPWCENALAANWVTLITKPSIPQPTCSANQQYTANARWYYDKESTSPSNRPEDFTSGPSEVWWLCNWCESAWNNGTANSHWENYTTLRTQIDGLVWPLSAIKWIISWSATMAAAANTNYNIKYTNYDSDAITNWKLVLSISSVQINWSPVRPTIVSMSPSWTMTSPWVYEFNLWGFSTWESKNIDLVLNMPAWYADNDSFTMTGNFTANSWSDIAN